MLNNIRTGSGLPLRHLLRRQVSCNSLVDIIDEILAYTNGVSSPDIFRQWSAISCVAGALERRVWTETSRGVLFPNLYVLLVAAPGIGKDQAIEPTLDLWAGTKKFHISPTDISGAALVDILRESDRKLQVGGHLMNFHSLLIGAPELGVLMSAHDLQFLAKLNNIYDNPKFFRERKRGIGKEIQIEKPQLNILAGAQPGFMASVLPEEAWSMGFTSRLIMIYAGSGPSNEIFGAMPDKSKPRTALVKMLSDCGNMVGQFEWAPEVVALMENWRKAGYTPRPKHSKLQHYIPRRPLHVMKLAMVAAVSRTQRLKIEVCDFNRARDWLIGAENLMPDIFREMVQKSDTQIIQELHFFMWQAYAKGAKKPIHESMVFHFLQQRVPSEKIDRIVDIACKSNIIVRQAGFPLYVPKPVHEHGIE